MTVKLGSDKDIAALMTVSRAAVFLDAVFFLNINRSNKCVSWWPEIPGSL